LSSIVQYLAEVKKYDVRRRFGPDRTAANVHLSATKWHICDDFQWCASIRFFLRFFVKFSKTNTAKNTSRKFSLIDTFFLKKSYQLGHKPQQLQSFVLLVEFYGFSSLRGQGQILSLLDVPHCRYKLYFICH